MRRSLTKRGSGQRPEKTIKKKRKVNGNLTRRPPARLIALYKVFKVSVKPFQRLGGVRGGSPERGLAECEAEPHEKRLVGFGAKLRKNSEFLRVGI